jgi:predicted small secreted protein
MKIFINNYLIALLLSLSFVLSSCGNSGDNAISDVSNEIRIINGTEYGGK